MSRKILITGINGQDGYFLSRLLVSEGHEVYGMGNQVQPSVHLGSEIKYFSCDIRNTDKVADFCLANSIQDIYNLAGVSSVAKSFLEPELTKEVNYLAPKRLLELFFKTSSADKRFFQASSSEMFGNAEEEPQNERTPMNPVSPYAQWKAELHAECQIWRDLGHFVCSAIMYNHESFLRPETFLSKKVVLGAVEIASEKRGFLALGNLSAERDWGFSGDFMEAVLRIMKLDHPDDFVIATGVCHSVLDMVRIAFSNVGLEGRELEFIRVDEDLMRPVDLNRLVGNYIKARNILGWEPRTTFEKMITEMIAFELKRI